MLSLILQELDLGLTLLLINGLTFLDLLLQGVLLVQQLNALYEWMD